MTKRKFVTKGFISMVIKVLPLSILVLGALISNTLAQTHEYFTPEEYAESDSRYLEIEDEQKVYSYEYQYLNPLPSPSPTLVIERVVVGASPSPTPDASPTYDTYPTPIPTASPTGDCSVHIQNEVLDLIEEEVGIDVIENAVTSSRTCAQFFPTEIDSSTCDAYHPPYVYLTNEGYKCECVSVAKQLSENNGGDAALKYCETYVEFKSFSGSTLNSTLINENAYSNPRNLLDQISGKYSGIVCFLKRCTVDGCLEEVPLSSSCYQSYIGPDGIWGWREV